MNLLRDFRDCLSILSLPDQKKYFRIVILQALLGFLDLLGIIALGVVGVIAVRGVKSLPPTSSMQRVLELLHLTSFNLQKQVAIIGVSAALILILRTILTMYFNWRILNFLANRSAKISNNLLIKMINQGILQIQSNNLSEIQFILGPGVFAIAIGIIGTASTIVADLSSLIIISLGVFLIDPIIALASIILFSTVGLFFYFILKVRIETFGSELMDTSIKSNKLISELMVGFRQIYVGNRTKYYSDEISETKRTISKLNALNSFIPSIGKYAIEITIVFGGALIAAAEFVFKDSTSAFSGLAIFIAAGTRVAPALLRIQQGAIAIKSHMSMSSITLQSIKKFGPDLQIEVSINKTTFEYKDFNPKVVISNVKFKYEGSKSLNLEVEGINIPSGSSLAIVGASGAGKTTLIDLLVGILKPISGEISISGERPENAISKWPGGIAYVPQDIFIIEGTIAENVALGYKNASISISHVFEALKIAQLLDFVKSLPNGIDTPIGERGVNLSGGQRQRLGIARAMYTKPKLLIFDEATSSLDGLTENDITTAIYDSTLNLTRVIIAHRLSTVVNADQVIYLSNGKILASGNFNEVREKIPDFDKSAKLMGL